MPSAYRYWSGSANDPVDKTLREAADAERRQRTALFKWASAQYDGKHKKFLKVKSGIVDPNVTINRDGQAIDDRLNFFFPEQLFTVQLDQSDEQSLAELDILGVFEDNGGTSFFQDCGLYGELTGHVYVRVQYRSKAQPNPDGTITISTEDPIRLIPMHPSSIISYWSAEDQDDVLWYEYQYATSHRYRIDFINWSLMGGSGWEIRKYQLVKNQWAYIGTEAWPYQNSPIIDWPHLRDPRSYYGRGALSASHLNDSLNKVASDVKQILRYHAAPRTIGKGVNPDDVVPTGIDNFLTIPGDTPTLKTNVFNLEMKSDLASSMTFLNYLDNAHDVEMKVVRLAKGIEELKNVTNLALQIAFAPLVTEANRVHRNYTIGVRKIILLILEIRGWPFLDVKPRIQWASSLPTSELEVTRTVDMQRDLELISRESAAAKLGINWAIEEPKIEAEKKEQEEETAANLAQILAGRPNPTAEEGLNEPPTES